MFSETAKNRFGLMGLIPASLFLVLSGTASAQSVEDNIRPVAQVCLAGESCVGSTAGGSSSSTMSTTAAVVEQAAEAVTEVVEEAVNEVAAEVAAAVSDFDVESTYQMSCFACHGAGAAGAPKLGDADAWAPRLEAGMDTLMANVINGVNAMPPKGLCMTCTDENLRSLVDYMVNQ